MMPAMRTTLTLDPEVAEALRREAALGKRSFKEIVNHALKRGLGLETASAHKRFRIKAHSSKFLPGIDPGRLNQSVDQLEAGEFLRRQRRKR